MSRLNLKSGPAQMFANQFFVLRSRHVEMSLIVSTKHATTT